MSGDQIRGWLLLALFLRAYPWGFFEAFEALLLTGLRTFAALTIATFPRK